MAELYLGLRTDNRLACDREVQQMDTDKAFMEAIQHLEAAKMVIDAMRLAKQEDKIDGRSLSIAITHLETCQLWVANARQ
jgi:hypothetical protein